MGKKTVNKEKAIELRKEGKTYPEIAEQLGCSVIWCSKNLKGIMITKDMSDTDLKESIKELLVEILKRI